MRAVIDTNIIVSAVLVPGSVPDQVLEASWARRFDVVTSRELLIELDDVLHRPRILNRIGWTVEDAERFMLRYSSVSDVVNSEITLHVLADEADNRVLEAARAGEADYIVTGDRELSALGSYEGTQIVAPALFVAILSAGPGP